MQRVLKAGIAVGGYAMQLVGGKPTSETGHRVQHQLKSCTYSFSTTPYVIRAAEQLGKQHPQLTSETLEYFEGKVRKCFIEFKGLLKVEFNKTGYWIMTHIMLPENYPTQAPLVRIVNIDPKKYVVDSFYEGMRSATDPTSYLIDGLETLKGWGAMSSLIAVIKELQKLLGVMFPFRKIPSQIANNAPKNVPPHNEPQLPKKLEESKYKQPPIPFKGQQEQPAAHISVVKKDTKKEGSIKAAQCRQQYLNRVQTFLGENQQVISHLETGRKKNFTACQRMNILNSIMKSETEGIISRNQQLVRFSQEHQNYAEVDLAKLVRPRDQPSEQLLELVSEKQALDDSLNFLEAHFSEDKIPFPLFMKLVRKVEEDRFTCRALLKRELKLRG